jgi:hypothetical protein
MLRWSFATKMEVGAKGATKIRYAGGCSSHVVTFQIAVEMPGPERSSDLHDESAICSLALLLRTECLVNALPVP